MQRTILAAALVAASPMAQAVIHFDELAHSGRYAFVNPIATQGFVIANDCGHGAGCLGIWGRDTPLTVDPGGAAVYVNYGGSVTTMARADGAAFDFRAIDLADVYNLGESLQMLFSFEFAGGTVEQTSVQLDFAVGTQTFVFGVTGVTRVSWVTTAGNSGWSQFDNIDTSPIPEPGALAMMLAGLGVLGSVARRRRS